MCSNAWQIEARTSSTPTGLPGRCLSSMASLIRIHVGALAPGGSAAPFVMNGGKDYSRQIISWGMALRY